MTHNRDVAFVFPPGYTGPFDEAAAVAVQIPIADWLELSERRRQANRIVWALKRTWSSPSDFSLFVRDVLRGDYEHAV